MGFLMVSGGTEINLNSLNIRSKIWRRPLISQHFFWDMFNKHRQDCEHPKNAQFDIYMQ